MKQSTKAKIVFQKVFQGNLKKGNFVKFNHGKVIWVIQYPTNGGGFYLKSLNSHWWISRYIGRKELHRIFQYPDIEALKWLLRNRPSEIGRYFKDQNKLILKLREIVPKPEF